MALVISTDTIGTQNFSSGSDSITINAGVTLSTPNGSPAISGFPSDVINHGTISTANYYSMILNAGNGTINSIVNDGTISAGSNGVNLDLGNITTFTNTGTITAAGSAINLRFGLCMGPCPAITTLNNLQGGATPLTYSGGLPTNYNIIIGSNATTTTGFGKVAFSNTNFGGSTTFGISPLSGTNIGTSGTRYQNVISGMSSAKVTNANTPLTYSSGRITATYQLVADDGQVAGTWDLLITNLIGAGPSASDTQTSLHASAQKLRGAFNEAILSSNFANMNTFDCYLFDTKGMCISTGGRFTTNDDPGADYTSAVLVLGYKVSPKLRIGAFMDQSVSNNPPSGIKLTNKTPMMGAFAVWNENADGMGYQVKLANTYQDMGITLTRDITGSSEAGAGSTNLNTQSYLGELSYALRYQDKTVLHPYAALRQTTVTQDAYTETGAATPLSYASIKDVTSTALLGLKLNHAATAQTALTASLGIEQDLDHQVDRYSANSAAITGLSTENLNANVKGTRAVASAGLDYALSKLKRISGEVFYQDLPFQDAHSTTLYLHYTASF